MPHLCFGGKKTKQQQKAHIWKHLRNFHQLVSEPTHLLPHSNSCIDLMFTDQQNLVVNCGIHSFLNSKCHHQISHCKLNHLSIEYPRPYERLVWHYKKVHIDNIKNSIKSLHREFLLNKKTVNRQVVIFNETILNIFSNFVPNKLVTFNDRDPPWMNNFVKNKIKWKHQIYKTYNKNGHTYRDYLKLEEATSVISELISRHKDEYHILNQYQILN